MTECLGGATDLGCSPSCLLLCRFSVCTFIDSCNKSVYVNGVKTEWDDGKGLEALRSRGVDFADVAKLDWDTALTAEDIRYDYGETRYFTLGLIDGRLHAMAWTPRGDAIRVISLRKANAREEKRYAEAS